MILISSLKIRLVNQNCALRGSSRLARMPDVNTGRGLIATTRNLSGGYSGFIALPSVEIDFWQLPSVLKNKSFRSEFLINFNVGRSLVSYAQFVMIVRPRDFNARR